MPHVIRFAVRRKLIALKMFAVREALQAVLQNGTSVPYKAASQV